MRRPLLHRRTCSERYTRDWRYCCRTHRSYYCRCWCSRSCHCKTFVHWRSRCHWCLSDWHRSICCSSSCRSCTAHCWCSCRWSAWACKWRRCNRCQFRKSASLAYRRPGHCMSRSSRWLGRWSMRRRIRTSAKILDIRMNRKRHCSFRHMGSNPCTRCDLGREFRCLFGCKCQGCP